ncbi:MAG: SUMF1/EgtB/PvdO family nonheme iron enzyme [Sulfuritalea sp.]|nr:SUMF1/EgtB/PvdO family nonheme iron enzyme [Sulfuritalea sp.]
MDMPNLRISDKVLLAKAMQEARDVSILLLDDWSSWTDRASEEANPHTTLDVDPSHVPCLDIINPPLWELGHVAWFMEYWCQRHQGESAGLKPSLLKDADRWYDSRHVAHDSRWWLDLPDWLATRRYLETTLDAALASLKTLPDTDVALYFHRLALFHEDMHHEAFRYTCQTLAWPAVDGLRDLPPSSDIALTGSEFLMGSSPKDTGFVFDNEKWAHPQRIENFAISATPTSNADFLAFLESDGYRQPKWWSSNGQAWLANSRQTMPRYWRLMDGRWQQRRFANWVDLVPAEPVIHLTAHEAEAWCRWAGRRLPSEAEWEFAALHADNFDWGTQVWEWTASPFTPYPGFSADPYAEYAEPFFHTHRSVRGGSFATHQRMRNPRYRNYYEAHRNDIFVGFRSCRQD